MSSESIHIAGRYNKYLRNLSQSPWIDKDDIRVKDSVQELIEEGLREHLKFDKSIFTSSGREDVDVRMLGRGRPFAFKITNPQFLADYNPNNLRKIERFVNERHAGKVKIRDLQIVTNEDVSKYMKDTQDSKQKEYRALCCCSRALEQRDVDRINSTRNLVINQMTPIRVLHRRTWARRKRTIYSMSLSPVSLGDFDSLRKEHLDRVFALVLTTEAGTYIKEFVHGDFGRTEPNLASLLGGDCETDLMELDVMISPDPLIQEEMQKPVEQDHNIASGHSKISDKMDESPEELSALYTKALRLMQDAETKPRGDERQKLYQDSRRLFEKTYAHIRSLDLFSDNENVDDIATTDLKYLLVPAHLAHIIISAECSPNRLETFTAADNYIREFLRRISHYQLGDDRVERALGDSGANEESPFGAQSSDTSLEVAMQKRNERIERYRKAKELEDKLNEADARVKALGEENVDHEVLRELYLLKIKKTTEDMLESHEKEVKPALYFERNRSSENFKDIKPHPSKLNSDGKIGRPITIVKDHLQKQVFGIGYPSRPTVTVDEFISKKINDGDLAFDKHKEVYANSLQRYAEQPNLRKEQEENSDEERDMKEDRDDEDELRRKRKWDEFKDDNPRGSGNRHNMG